MARRNDHTREQLRALILDAALDLIEEDGVAALSTRKIAQKIGYTSGTLYQHFDDIRSIVLAVNARTMQGLIDAMAGSGPSLPADPADRVHAYADIYLAYVKAHRNAWDAMFAWRRSEGEAVPDWYARQIATLVELVGDCFAKIEAGPDAGTPQEAARLVWASVHSVCALESGGRLELIMQTPLEPLVHRLVTIHIEAYASRNATPT
jgi:AcrR family transcriptional regulator